MKDRVLRPELRTRVTTIVSSEREMRELLPPSAYPMQPTWDLPPLPHINHTVSVTLPHRIAQPSPSLPHLPPLLSSSSSSCSLSLSLLPPPPPAPPLPPSLSPHLLPRTLHSSSICSRFVHMSISKDRCAVQATCWTPGARRCLSGSADGKFTLWNGSSFNFETTQTGHEGGIRSLCWSHSQEWMLSADTEGIVKYWQPNLSNVKEVVCHKDNPVREVRTPPAPTPPQSPTPTCPGCLLLVVWEVNTPLPPLSPPPTTVPNSHPSWLPPLGCVGGENTTHTPLTTPQRSLTASRLSCASRWLILPLTRLHPLKQGRFHLTGASLITPLPLPSTLPPPMSR